MIKALSILISGLALFNFIRNIFDIGLQGIVLDVVKYYHNIFYPIIDFIGNKIHWAIPDWNYDSIVLIAVINGIHARFWSESIFLKYDLLQNTEELPPMGVSLAFRYGIMLPFHYLSGAMITFHSNPSDLFSMKRPRLLAILFSYFWFMLFTLFIPYIRELGVFAITCLILMAFLIVIGAIEPGDEKGKIAFKILLRQYVYAIFGALVFLLLNLYAPSPN